MAPNPKIGENFYPHKRKPEVQYITPISLYVWP